MSEHILEMQNITKEFPGVRALDSVNLKVRRGEIHALVGENGAGKSTLMKVLSGVYPAGTYEGKILVNGEEKHFSTIKDSEECGIAVIYQELALVPLMDVAENIYLGSEKAGKIGIINWAESYAESARLLKEVKLDVNPHTKLINLGVGKQQLIEIAKALAKETSLLILDEPTAALNEAESENLLNILRELKAKGVTCIYISHKLEEVLSIADSITVLRDGNSIASHNQTEEEGGGWTQDRIISLMVGRTLTQRFPKVKHNPGEVIMEIKDWNVEHPEIPGKKLIDNANFQIRKGEILGLAGLMGAGRTELCMSLFGAFKSKSWGTVHMEGNQVVIKEPADAIKLGFSYVTEDRKAMGLVLGMDILENTTLASLLKVSRRSVLNKLEEIKQTKHYVKQLNIKTPTVQQKARNLSGGNQQKVILGKWLMTEPKVLILDEPTRGIDVGAKFEIYNIMNDLVEQGVAIVMISSELPEVLGMSDRILVMHEGRLTGELSAEEATQEKVMYYATRG
jgi:ABC-type sugar transport system ATPase subunit